MVFSMNMKLNTSIRKHSRQFSGILCLIFTFIFLMGVMLHASADYTGTFLLISVNPETAFVTPDGSIHRLPDATYIQIFFDYVTQTASDKIVLDGNSLYLNRQPMADLAVYAEFVSFNENPNKHYHGNLNITGLPVMYAHYGEYSIDILENDKPTSVLFDFKELTRGWYNVQFRDWDDQIVIDDYERGDQAVPHGGNAIEPDHPKRYGYTFTGWDRPFTNVTQPLIVRALYDKNPYEVTFIANADADPAVVPNPESMTVLFDDAYGTLAAISRDYYTFDGWFTEPVGGVEVTAATVLKLAEDHNLYAHWTPIVYTISYVLDHGELHPGVNANGNPKEYTVESTFPINIENPAKFAYDFQGWMITYANEFTTPLPSGGIPIGTTGNIILSALWTPAKYNIIYDLGVDGSLLDPTNPDGYTVENFPNHSIIDPTNPDYVFMGWKVKYENGFKDPGLKFDYVIPAGTTGDITFYAQWIHEGGVSKDIVDRFVFVEDNPVSYDISYVYEIPANISDVESFKIVDSWLPKDSLSYAGSYVLKIDKENVTSTNISVVPDDGSVTFVINPVALADSEGKLLTLMVTFMVDDAAQGISNNVKVFINNILVGEDTEALCLISYDPNWPVVNNLPVAGNGAVPSSYLYKAGSEITVAGNDGELVVDGWVFIGWSMAINGSGGVFVEDDIFTGKADTVLYAQWVPVGDVTKEILGGPAGSYKSGDQIKYVVSYKIPSGIGSGVSLKIVDTWTPLGGLTYVGAFVKINGGVVTEGVDYTVVSDAGEVVF
ncbi:MAG: InlB B-repeat-containing protein, partial [Nitrososphaerota archaeon]|nr:InlB B-repeat-containing protein [Nitrososphaerota archaeon]